MARGIVRQRDHLRFAEAEFDPNAYAMGTEDMGPLSEPTPHGGVPTQMMSQPDAAPSTPATPTAPGVPSSTPTSGGSSGGSNNGPNTGGKLLPDTQATMDWIHKTHPEFSNIGGWREPDGFNEHSSGHALDVMMPKGYDDNANGMKFMQDAFKSNPHIKYILHNQRQWNPDGSSSAMENRGSPTANHYDHFHINVGSRRGGIVRQADSLHCADAPAGPNWTFDNSRDRNRTMADPGNGGLSNSPMAPSDNPGLNAAQPKGKTFGGDPSKLPAGFSEQFGQPKVPEIPGAPSIPGGSPSSSGLPGTPVPPGTGAERWRPLVHQTLQSQMGQYGITQQNLKAIEDQEMKQIQTESGGNPGAINNSDSNAVKGTPSQGVLQFIKPTFDSYNVSHGQFTDPAAQIAAFGPYVYSRYGLKPGNAGYNFVGEGHGY